MSRVARPSPLPAAGRAALALAAGAAAVVLLQLDPAAVARGAEALRGRGALAALPLAAAYLVGMVLFVPSPLLHLAAGYVLGPFGGMAVGWPASVAGACAAFLLGRTLARGLAARLAARFPTIAALDVRLEAGGARAVALARLAGVVPFTVLNFACGATRLRLGAFAAGTAAGSLPSLVLAVWAGSLAASASELSLSRARPAAWVVLAGLGLAALGGAWLARRALRRAGRPPPGAKP